MLIYLSQFGFLVWQFVLQEDFAQLWMECSAYWELPFSAQKIIIIWYKNKKRLENDTKKQRHYWLVKQQKCGEEER